MEIISVFIFVFMLSRCQTIKINFSRRNQAQSQPYNTVQTGTLPSTSLYSKLKTQIFSKGFFSPLRQRMLNQIDFFAGIPRVLSSQNFTGQHLTYSRTSWKNLTSAFFEGFYCRRHFRLQINAHSPHVIRIIRFVSPEISQLVL